MKEHQENLKDQRLRQRELDELNLNNNDDSDIKKELTTKLETFEIDKSSEH